MRWGRKASAQKSREQQSSDEVGDQQIYDGWNILEYEATESESECRTESKTVILRLCFVVLWSGFSLLAVPCLALHSQPARCT